MDALLNAELGDEDVERLVEDADDSRGAHDGAVALGEIVDEHAEEEVRRLLLREPGGLLLRVARLRDLRHRFGVERELGLGRCDEEVSFG